jgi:hypothetical protein
MLNITGFQIPGYNDTTSGEPIGMEDAKEASNTAPKNYIIPPVLWMVAFLVIGYLGLAYLVEGE